MKKYGIIGLLLAGLMIILVAGQVTAAETSKGKFSSLKPRSIGPANMSGRIADIDVVLSNPRVIYIGTATGGVWKSINNGISWDPVFDDQPVSSIGAVKIFQANPNIVWVGTGEANPRNSAGVGRGVFKTIDGGKTWKKLGLEKTEKISRIVLHPSDPDVAYVAAMGTTWGENPQRGVFKTMDGGRTWNKILYVNERTGAADLAIQPGNPNTLMAAMWDHRRWPWFFKSGGPGSGIHLTRDGGATWKRLDHKKGVPEGDLGRIGLAFSTNKPHIAYAIIEAKKNVLLRSEDGGATWKTVNQKPQVSGRPFYYSDIRVNPQNENIVYSLQSLLRVSEDGGKSFKALASFFQVHPDYQALWIHPDGETMIVGNDGGIAISADRGRNWRYVQNLPLAQFYHISYDMEYPYNVYGGLQDNGSWRGPSTVLTDPHIFDCYWRLVGFGDGFDTEPDPEDSDCGYAMSQGGHLFYYNFKTGLRRSIRPSESDVKHRYNWNAGFAVDPFHPATIYYGSQFVHRSRDKGRTWEIISPDLTTNDPEKQKQAQSGGLTLDVTDAENHTSILCIAPSAIEEGVMWVGTDDGHVQLTRDGGKTWKRVSTSLTGTKNKKRRVPYGTWVPHVEADKFDAAGAYVIFDDHRRSNWTPYVFVTHDYGKSWQSLATKELDGFLHVIEQDTQNKDLLFLGGEFGLFISFNGGEKWEKWTWGLPTVAVRDLAVHPRDHDLIIGTHGRAAYILDDITPLRTVTEGTLKEKAHLFPLPDTPQYRSGWSSAYLCPGDAVFKGKNREDGALITYVFNPVEEAKKGDKDSPKPKLKLEILDKKGEVIRNLKPEKDPGLNRVTWDFCRKGFRNPWQKKKEDYDSSGIPVLPGNYTVRLSYGDIKITQPVNILSDPRLEQDLTILVERETLAMEVGAWMENIADVHTGIGKTRKALKTVLDNLKESKLKEKEALEKEAKELDKKLEKLDGKIVPDRDSKGIPDSSDIIAYQVSSLIWGAAGDFGPISQATRVKYQKVRPRVEKILSEYNRLYANEINPFEKRLEKAGFSLFQPFLALSLEDKKKS